MSYSKEYNQARTVAIAMGRTSFMIPANNPTARGFNPKLVPITCRRCKGTGCEDGSPDNCIQCAGKGVEKLSLKRLNQLIRKQQAESDGGKISS
jgi:hypothetical protein